MKAASLKEIKTELDLLYPVRLKELCLHLAKYRKENKELLSYLLFDAEDENTYIQSIKEHLDELFKEVNKYNSYQAKKTIRKILRIASKYIKFSGSKKTEIEVLIHFCKKFRKLGISMPANSVLANMYSRQVAKIHKALESLHEDLQYDYADEIKLL